MVEVFDPASSWDDSIWLVSLLYNLGADPTENTASKNPSIIVMAVA
jgi:hypothetical protein